MLASAVSRGADMDGGVILELVRAIEIGYRYRYLTSSSMFASAVSRGANMNGSVILELIRAVEDTPPVIRAHHSKLIRSIGLIAEHNLLYV
jgi:hypothetical protein